MSDPKNQDPLRQPIVLRPKRLHTDYGGHTFDCNILTIVNQPVVEVKFEFKRMLLFQLEQCQFSKSTSEDSNRDLNIFLIMRTTIIVLTNDAYE